MKKIAVVGVSCSGKTTLGINLSKVLGSKPIDIDEIHWRPGWVSTPTEELIPKVEEALQCPKWIVSGNYSALQSYVFGEADTIIWLDYSPIVVAVRALRRTLKRAIFKVPCCNGNYESIKMSFFSKDSILLWILKTYKRRKLQYETVMADPLYSTKTFIRLKTPKEARQLVNSFRS